MMVLVFLIVNTWFWDSIGIALEIVKLDGSIELISRLSMIES